MGQSILLRLRYTKMHFIIMGYTTPPQKYWNYTKINAWEDHEVWKCLDYIGIGLIGDGYFYIERLINSNYSISTVIFDYDLKLSL